MVSVLVTVLQVIDLVVLILFLEHDVFQLVLLASPIYETIVRKQVARRLLPALFSGGGLLHPLRVQVVGDLRRKLLDVSVLVTNRVYQTIGLIVVAVD